MSGRAYDGRVVRLNLSMGCRSGGAFF